MKPVLLFSNRLDLLKTFTAVFLRLTDKPHSYNRFIVHWRLCGYNAISTRSPAQSRCDTLTPSRSGTDMSEMLLSFSDRSLMKHLNSSGDIGWPCSGPQRISFFSESLFRSLIRAEELLYIKSRHLKNRPFITNLARVLSQSVHMISQSVQYFFTHPQGNF